MKRILYKHIDMSERKYMRNFGRRSVCVRTKGILSRICRLYSVIGWFRTLEKIDGYGKNN